MTAEGDFGERFIHLARETRKEGVDLLGQALTVLPAGDGRPLDRLISFVGEANGVALDKNQEELARKAFARAWKAATASGQIPEPYNGLDFPGLIAFTLRQQGFLPSVEPVADLPPDAGAEAATPAQEVPARILMINEALRQANAPTASITVGSKEFEGHFKSLSLPGELEVRKLDLDWHRGFRFNAGLATPLSPTGKHTFFAFYSLDPDSQESYAKVDEVTRKDNLLRQELENYMSNLPANIAQNLSSQIEPGWEMTGMHFIKVGGKLYFDFKKREPEAKAEPPATDLPPDEIADARSASVTAAGETVPATRQGELPEVEVSEEDLAGEIQRIAGATDITPERLAVLFQQYQAERRSKEE